MMDIRSYFYDKLIFEELAEAEENVLPLTTPWSSVPKSSNPNLNETALPESLNEIYRQVNKLDVSWFIWPIPTETKPNEIPEVLKQDPWLKENYWNEGYGWGIIHEYLSGFINIQKLEDILNPEFCKEQHFYMTLEHQVKSENPDDYLPFDIHWDLTACLKKEAGQIQDNIWLVFANGRKMYDMKITIEKYLELCYKAKGFHYWQLTYIWNQENSEYGELMKRYLPMLFPHLELDLSDFGIDTGKS